MSADRLISVCIRGVSGVPHLTWAEASWFRLPYSLLIKSGMLEYVDPDGNLAMPGKLPPIDPNAGGELRLRAAFTEVQPWFTNLPISYQIIPPRVRSLMGRAMGRWRRRQTNRWAAFPTWPLDLSADFLIDLVGQKPSPFAKGRTPVILTHDLDSPEGLKNLAEKFLGMEESVGAQSVNFIVPCAWEIDHRLLDQVREGGHEIGVHGYDHSNRTAFCPAAERRRRLLGGQTLRERYGAMGYRAPSLWRTKELLQDLAEFYQYDSSIPTSGGLFPVPNNGCASARPFRIDGIMEIPLTLPRDGSLIFLGYSPPEILDMWIACAERISRAGGVVVLLTHCESRFSGNESMLGIYREFLRFVHSSSKFAFRTIQAVIQTAGDS